MILYALYETTLSLEKRNMWNYACLKHSDRKYNVRSEKCFRSHFLLVKKVLWLYSNYTVQNFSYTTTFLFSNYVLRLGFRSVLGNIDVYDSKRPNIWQKRKSFKLILKKKIKMVNMASWIKLKSIENISWQWNSSYVLWPIFPTAFQRIAVFTWKQKRDSISSWHELLKHMENNCLFVWSFSSHSKNFHSFGDVTIAGEVLQILTYARH